jgi:tetratricopeptide (TPR) repeat protein
MKKAARHKRQPLSKRSAESGFFTLLQQGTQALHQGRTTAAVKLLEQAHHLEPDQADAALNLGGAYILAKKFKQAVAVLEPLSQRQPGQPMVWTNLGAAYLGNPVLANDEQQQRAIAAFQQALALDPKTPHVAYNLGLIYRDRQDNETALYWFRRALEADPNDRDAQAYIQQLTSGEDTQPIQ